MNNYRSIMTCYVMRIQINIIMCKSLTMKLLRGKFNFVSIVDSQICLVLLKLYMYIIILSVLKIFIQSINIVVVYSYMREFIRYFLYII